MPLTQSLPSPSPQAQTSSCTGDREPVTRPPRPPDRRAWGWLPAQGWLLACPVAPQCYRWPCSHHSPALAPVSHPGCPCSDCSRNPRSMPEPFQVTRLWLQRGTSLTQAGVSYFSIHSRGSVLRFRKIRMDCFCACPHGTDCLDSDRQTNLEGYTWSIRAGS